MDVDCRGSCKLLKHTGIHRSCRHRLLELHADVCIHKNACVILWYFLRFYAQWDNSKSNWPPEFMIAMAMNGSMAAWMQILGIKVCISNDSAGVAGVSQIPLVQLRKKVFRLFCLLVHFFEMSYHLSNFIICLKIKDEKAVFEKVQVLWDCSNSLRSKRNWILLASPVNLLRCRAVLWLHLTRGRAVSPVPGEGSTWLRNCRGFWRLLCQAALCLASQTQMVAWDHPQIPSSSSPRQTPARCLEPWSSVACLLLLVLSVCGLECHI